MRQQPHPNIWALATANISGRELEMAKAILSQQELEQAFRFRQSASHIGYVMAHGLARLALAQAADCRPTSLQFKKGLYGRPQIVGPQVARDLWFSLSHAEGLIGVAVALAPIGVDVESADRDIDYLAIAEDVLTEGEMQSLLTLDSAKRKRRFIQLWTLKEAYLKATGHGFLGDPRSCDFHCIDDHLMSHTQSPKDNTWVFSSRYHDTGHWLASCHTAQTAPAQFHSGRTLLNYHS